MTRLEESQTRAGATQEAPYLRRGTDKWSLWGFWRWWNHIIPKEMNQIFLCRCDGDWMFRARALTAEQTRSTVMVNGAMWPLKSNGLKTGSFLGLEKVHSDHSTKTKFKTLKNHSFSFHFHCNVWDFLYIRGNQSKTGNWGSGSAGDQGQRLLRQPAGVRRRMGKSRGQSCLQVGNNSCDHPYISYIEW